MKAILLLALFNTILIKCRASPPAPLLLPSTPQITSQYPFPNPVLDDSKKHVVPNNLLPIVTVNNEKLNQLHQNPFTNNYKLNIGNNHIKSLNEENEGQMRLKLFYNNLADKFRNKLLSKVSNQNNEQSSKKEKENHQNVATNKQENLNFIDGRKKATDTIIKDSDNLVVAGGEHPNLELYEVQLLNQMSNKEDLGFLESGAFSYDNDDSLKEVYMDSINNDLPVLRYPTNVYTHTFDTVPNTGQTVQTSVTLLNNKENPVSQNGLIPGNYFYRQPIFNIKNPFNSLYKTIKYPINSFLDFKNNLFNYGKHNQYKYNNNEVENIKRYITEIMKTHKHSNPQILQIMNDAHELDLTKLENLDQSQLISLSKNDLESLKRYVILILNKYGITPYTYKLMEFINLVERKPKQGPYLLYKVLNNQRGVQSLTQAEINQIKQHLQQMLKEYGSSPYVLPFVQHIDGIQLLPSNNEKLYIYGLDTLDSLNYISEENMRKIYLYFLQAYRSNPNIIRILQYLNDIYEKSNSNTAQPILDLRDLQNLSYLNYNDLNLFAKYLSQTIKQRGANTYTEQLLAYLKQLQAKFDKGKDKQNIDVDINYEFDKRIDLSSVYKYLQHLNEIGVLNSHIIDILKRLNISNGMDISVIKLNDTDLSENDLEQIRQFLDYFNQQDNQNEKPVSLLDDTIDIRFDDLQQIYKYLLKQHNFIKSPYLIIILNLLKQTQNKPNNDEFVKVRYQDFLQIYYYLTQIHEDTTNPIFIMIQQYVNQKNKNNNIIIEDNNVNNEIISDKLINLYEIYNYLLHKKKSEKMDPGLLEILHYLNTTFLLPNGELKIKIVNLNNTAMFDRLYANDLRKLLLYVQYLKDNKVYLNELLQYVKEKRNNEYEQSILILSGASPDSLRRIKNFLLTFIKEQGEIPYVLQILLEINRILGVPDNDRNYILDGTDSKANGDDLDILTNYISTVKDSNFNGDVLKLYENIREYREKIKEEKEKRDKNSKYKVFFLEIINNDQVSPAIKDIINDLYLNIDVDVSNDNSNTIPDTIGNKRLSTLSNKDLDVLVTYLRQFLHMFGPNPRIQKIIFSIEKIKENGKVIIVNNTDLNEDEKNKYVIKITKDNLNFINKHVLELINQYGEDPNIMRIIYTINNIEGRPDNAGDWTKVITNNNDGFLKLDAINILKTYLVKLIQKYGSNHHLIKILRGLNTLHRGREEDTDRPIVQVNSTHTLVVLERDDIKRIKSYLMDIINNQGFNPYLLNILNVINVVDINTFNNSNSNVYPFARISRNDFNQLIQYILQLIEKLGARNELLYILDFVYRIYGDSYLEKNENDDEKLIIEITKEIQNLRDKGVVQIMQNMDRGKLTTLYLQLLHKIFAGTSSGVNIELSTVLRKILDVYKVESDAINKYIILKLYEYLLKNKGRGYENFGKPEFINVLLEIKGNWNDIYPHKVIIPSEKKYVIVEPYDYNKDIETALKIIINSTINNTWKNINSDESIKKDLFDYTISDNSDKESNYKKVACVIAEKKLEDIQRVLYGVITSKQIDLDFTKEDLNRIIDMFLIFKKKLSRGMNRDNIPTRIVIDELEKILLSHQHGKCDQVLTTSMITPIVDSIREGILYLKLNHYGDEQIKSIVEASLIEDVLPELKSVAVRECVVKANKDLLNGLYNNVFKNDEDLLILDNKKNAGVSHVSQTNSAAV